MSSMVIKFWFLLIVLIPSIFFSLFVISHILLNRTLRSALHNHVIIILLCIGFFCQVTNYPWMLYFYSASDGWVREPTFCVAAVFIDWALYVIQTILFAWATIERHLLIFHDRLVEGKRGRFLFHYLPLAILLLYGTIYYVNVIIFPPCENISDPTSLQCIIVCFVFIRSLFLYEAFAHQIAPVFIIVISSLLLLVRVICQKHHLHQAIQWRRYRKMTIQLLSISSLYIIFSLPLAIVLFIRMYCEPSSMIADALDLANFLSYFPLLFVPGVCSISIPELRLKLKRLIRF